MKRFSGLNCGAAEPTWVPSFSTIQSPRTMGLAAPSRVSGGDSARQTPFCGDTPTELGGRPFSEI
jgi:hypothetical protein